MAAIKLTSPKGTQNFEAIEGWRVMEILRDNNVPGIDGTCGGACDCGSCRIIVHPNWQQKLPAPRNDELDKLDELPAHHEGQRLSCQLIWSDSLDGLELILTE